MKFIVKEVTYEDVVSSTRKIVKAKSIKQAFVKYVIKEWDASEQDAIENLKKMKIRKGVLYNEMGDIEPYDVEIFIGKKLDNIRLVQQWVNERQEW